MSAKGKKNRPPRFTYLVRDLLTVTDYLWYGWPHSDAKVYAAEERIFHLICECHDKRKGLQEVGPGSSGSGEGEARLRDLPPPPAVAPAEEICEEEKEISLCDEALDDDESIG